MDARRVAHLALNNAFSAGANKDGDKPQEISESFLGEVSSTVKSAFDNAIIISCDEEDAFEVFNDVSLSVIEKILGDIVATVEFDINNELTQIEVGERGVLNDNRGEGFNRTHTERRKGSGNHTEGERGQNGVRGVETERTQNGVRRKGRVHRRGTTSSNELCSALENEKKAYWQI